MSDEVDDRPQFVSLDEGQAEGFCDPLTGACVWPGRATAVPDGVEGRPTSVEPPGGHDA